MSVLTNRRPTTDKPGLAEAFRAFDNPNYRRYFIGQTISLAGTWMQTVAQSWLVLTITGSAASLGFVIALQTLPVLLLGPYGGVVADRLDKRKLMIFLQSVMGVLALVLGILTVTSQVQLWQVYVLALLLGLCNTFENPARQSFVLEMVGPDLLRNAVTLNSVLVNAARAVGPALAGLLIASVGIGICFLFNAVSFVAVVFSLVTLDLTRIKPSVPTSRARGQLRAGLSYVRHTPSLAIPLVMMALIGCLAYEFQVVLPLMARETFGGGAEVYGFMTASMGVGAVIGGLMTAARGRTGQLPLVISSVGFGFAILFAALAPDLAVELIALGFVGAGSVSFLATGNSTLQLGADPQMRGRVMALWAVAFLGSTPIGGPIAGAVAQTFGARWGLVMGALACFGGAAIGLLSLSRSGGIRSEHGPKDDRSAKDDLTRPDGSVLPAPEPAMAGTPEVSLAAGSFRAQLLKNDTTALPEYG
jgi:MFS family permease